jgi:hypothetical protein
MHTHHLLTLAVNANATGPGLVMRGLIVTSVVGVVLIAWFVLRGYRD